MRRQSIFFAAVCWTLSVATAGFAAEAREDSLLTLLDAESDPAELLAAVETEPVAAAAGGWSAFSECRADRARLLLDGARGGVFARCELRRDVAENAFGGAAGWRGGGVELAGGRFGVHLGHGLLQAGAGRRTGLAAGAAPPVGADGWRRRGALAAAGDLVGGLCAGRRGASRWLLWRGTRDAVPVTGVAIDCGGPVRLGASLVDEASGAAGAGIRLRLERPAVRAEAEAALWRAGPAAPRRGAAAATLVCGPGRLHADFQAALVEPGFAPPGGGRPAVLCGAAGRGWAASLRWRGRGIVLAGLLAAAAAPDWRDGAPEETAVRRVELTGAGGASGLRWEFRLTRREERRRGWVERHPWLPAAEGAPARDTRLSCRWERDSGTVRWRAEWRTLRRERSTDDDRSLLALRADVPVGADWRLRGGAVWAWGGTADLTSVAAPAPGWLLPRHWGGWRDELSLGFAGRPGRFRLSGGVVLRRPAAAAGPARLEARISCSTGHSKL